MKLKFFAIVIILFSSSFVLHKYYVSVSEVNFNKENKRLEVALKVFNDDWQNALDRRLGEPVLLGSKKEYAQIDSLISLYINEHFKFKVNGVNKRIKYLGHELENDASWLYFYTEEINTDISEIEIYNSVMTEMFDEQRNLVQIKVGDISRSGFFTKSRTTKVFSFK